jgi:hypothetical protein
MTASGTYRAAPIGEDNCCSNTHVTHTCSPRRAKGFSHGSFVGHCGNKGTFLILKNWNAAAVAAVRNVRLFAVGVGGKEVHTGS